MKRIFILIDKDIRNIILKKHTYRKTIVFLTTNAEKT